ncbi:MAG TPA: 50S ribosomal protein L13 [Thermoanaerobaculia bacterium]|jgi:large subunit ribosomal protein L13|nr:50S ribosomal protein L13 [Thermoanaerobaculia bacterium]
MNSGTTTAASGAIHQEWWVVDASNKVLGRLATRVARILSGKHRASYLPYRDTGDFVVVTNAEKIVLTGRKSDEKMYHRHTGYPGGLKSVAAKDLTAKHPERVIEAAVRGMLPKSKLGRRQLKKLKVYRGPSHPHEAQKPRVLTLPVRRAAS